MAARRSPAHTPRRGYFGVAIYQPKTEPNLGILIRSAYNFGAAFVVTIGDRYRHWPRLATDTGNFATKLPLFRYADLDEFVAHRPHDCEIVRVEVDGDRPLPAFTHLPRAIYLFGGEDRSVPPGVGERSVRIATPFCLNLAVAASIVLYDRAAKLGDGA